jgi:uncharacterized protein YndB with AHSA1/START domain
MNDHRDQPLDVSSSDSEQRHAFVIERRMAASAKAIFDAWTTHFDTWFASAGEMSMNASPGEPYWFNVVHEGERYAHYGKFLRVEYGRLIEQTWVTGRNGTDGAKTVVLVELESLEVGADLRLAHGGFYDEESARRHRDSWSQILEHLDASLRRSV